jgi:hypothetical protein
MNPASRILAIYDKALNFQPGAGAPYLRLWGSVFGISENADHTHEDEVVAGLAALRGEIGLARTRLVEKGCPLQLFDSQLNRIKAIASPTLLNQDCKGVKAEHKNDVRLALEWAAWVLPDEEAEVATEDIASLAAELIDIEESITQLDLAPQTRDFMLRQIGLIRAALRLYGINGIAPVEEALEQSIGVLKRSAAATKDLEGAAPEVKGVWRRVAGVLTRVADLADKVDKVHKGAQAMKSIGSAVHDAYDAVTKLLPPG